MNIIKEYASPDDQLKFVVAHDEWDVSLRFEGFPWHTHADVLASTFGTSEELAVNRFVRHGSDDEVLEFRYWSGEQWKPM